MSTGYNATVKKPLFVIISGSTNAALHSKHIKAWFKEAFTVETSNFDVVRAILQGDLSVSSKYIVFRVLSSDIASFYKLDTEMLLWLDSKLNIRLLIRNGKPVTICASIMDGPSLEAEDRATLTSTCNTD